MLSGYKRTSLFLPERQRRFITNDYRTKNEVNGKEEAEMKDNKLSEEVIDQVSIL
jgi:hypothetical protein